LHKHDRDKAEGQKQVDDEDDVFHGTPALDVPGAM